MPRIGQQWSTSGHAAVRSVLHYGVLPYTVPCMCPPTDRLPRRSTPKLFQFLSCCHLKAGEETEQDTKLFCQQQLQDKPLGVPLQMAVTPWPSVEARSPFSSNCNTQSGWTASCSSLLLPFLHYQKKEIHFFYSTNAPKGNRGLIGPFDQLKQC